MQILVIGIVAAVLLLLIPKILGGKQDQMLKQYEVLEKRFGLQHRVSQSKWGKGIGEHHRLDGSYHGCPVSLYGHYNETGNKRVFWTSLVFETLFAGEFEFDISLGNVPREARYPKKDFISIQEIAKRTLLLSNRPDAEIQSLVSDRALQRIGALANRERAGSIRLSKGFLEYRECGDLLSDEMRERFQDAFLVLGELSDGIAEVARTESARS